jgi:Domain of unknown function (DUF1707)
MMPGDPRLRASDADRERTVELLREHHAVGRISAEEYDERLNKVFAAKTLGELSELLADLPAIDLYQLPSAGIRPAQGGVVRSRRRGNVGATARGDLQEYAQQMTHWLFWAGGSSLLLFTWLGVGIATGGLAWVPWFLLIVIPWAVAIARRPHGLS